MNTDEQRPLPDDLQRLLKDAMHEIREFNRIIKANSEMLTRLLQIEKNGTPLSLDPGNADGARNQAITILHTAQMVSARLDLIDFEINPESFSTERKTSVVVYAKFDKARKMLMAKARHKGVKIKISGKSKRQLDMYPVFDMLPFLLVENAVKYAPAGTEASIAISETTNSIDVEVESLGPVVQVHELDKIVTKGFRGEEANRTGEKGSGYGLYFASFIARLHDANLSFHIGTRTFEYNKCIYSTFSARLCVPT